MTQSERRSHLRIALKGSAILMAGDHMLRGRISNLCEGGLLATTVVTAPSVLVGRAVDIEMRLDSQSAQWLRVTGTIVRIGAERIAVRFSKVPAALVRLIDDMTVEARNRRRVLVVVVVDDSDERRAPLAEAFRAVGCTVIEASTALETIVRLGETSFEPDLIAVSDAATADDIRGFVSRNHPRVKLVMIDNDTIEPAGIEQRVRQLLVD